MRPYGCVLLRHERQGNAGVTEAKLVKKAVKVWTVNVREFLGVLKRC